MNYFVKPLIISLLLSSSAVGYESGDKIQPSIVKELSLKADKVYVINFFASWCKSCKHELPLINKLSEKIPLIGVNVDRDHKIGEEFVNNIKLDFPVVYDNESNIIKAFDPIGVPAIYFVKDHRVVAQKIGAVDDIDSYILKIFEEIK